MVPARENLILKGKIGIESFSDQPRGGDIYSEWIVEPPTSKLPKKGGPPPNPLPRGSARLVFRLGGVFDSSVERVRERLTAVSSGSASQHGFAPM